MDLTQLSCEDFLSRLASKAPAPGGGGAAALVGAAGVALGNMVGDLTTGKKKYAAVEEEILALNARAEALRKRLEASCRRTPTHSRLWRRPTACPERRPNSRPARPLCWPRRWTGPAPCRWTSWTPAVRHPPCGRLRRKGQCAGCLRRRLCGAVLQGRTSGVGAECRHQHKAHDRPRPCRRAGRKSGPDAGGISAAGRRSLPVRGKPPAG